MKVKLITLLQLQDSFKSSFHFHFNGKKNIYYPIGTIVSIFINLSALTLLLTLVNELIYHSQPNVNFSEFHTSMTHNLTLNTKDLLFTIASKGSDSESSKEGVFLIGISSILLFSKISSS